MNCNKNCQICPNIAISSGVSIVTVDGTDTLVIDFPAGTVFNNMCEYCIIVAQTVPDAATINMPVAFSIGGVTTTVYPFINCNCVPVTACAIRSRTKYATRLHTNATGGVFRSSTLLRCYPANNLPSIPAPTTTTTPAG